jgi:hypothetical protein
MMMAEEAISLVVGILVVACAVNLLKRRGRGGTDEECRSCSCETADESCARRNAS